MQLWQATRAACNTHQWSGSDGAGTQQDGQGILESVCYTPPPTPPHVSPVSSHLATWPCPQSPSSSPLLSPQPSEAGRVAQQVQTSTNVYVCWCDSGWGAQTGGNRGGRQLPPQDTRHHRRPSSSSPSSLSSSKCVKEYIPYLQRPGINTKQKSINYN